MFPTIHGIANLQAVGALVYDTFTDSDTTLITAHTPDIDTSGGGWSSLNGSNYEIDTNQIKLSSSTARSIAAIDATVADYTITCTWVMSGQSVNQNAGIAFRVVDGNNYFVFAPLELNNQVRILEYNAGSAVVRALKSLSVVGTVTAKVVVSGSNVECFIDDVSHLTYGSVTDTSETKVGIHADQSTSFRWDDYRVEQ